MFTWRMMGRTGIRKLDVRADGSGLSSRAGTALLPLVAGRDDESRLTRGILISRPAH
jgi:hypothetical protein